MRLFPIKKFNAFTQEKKQILTRKRGERVRERERERERDTTKEKYREDDEIKNNLVYVSIREVNVFQRIFFMFHLFVSDNILVALTFFFQVSELIASLI